MPDHSVSYANLQKIRVVPIDGLTVFTTFGNLDPIETGTYNFENLLVGSSYRVAAIRRGRRTVGRLIEITCLLGYGNLEQMEEDFLRMQQERVTGVNLHLRGHDQQPHRAEIDLTIAGLVNEWTVHVEHESSEWWPQTSIVISGVCSADALGLWVENTEI